MLNNNFKGIFSKRVQSVIKLLSISAVMAASATTSSSSYAATAIAVGVGTLGYQVALSQSISENLNLRLTHNTASKQLDGETDGVNYDYDFEFSSNSLLIDWHMFDGSFRLTTGALINDNQIHAQSDIDGLTLNVGDNTFTRAEVGRLEGDIGFDSYAPYLGFGWGRAIADGFSVVFDLGVVYQGQPEVSLQTIGGTLSDNPLLLEQVEREEQELQEDVDEFDLYPVISLGLFYRF